MLQEVPDDKMQILQLKNNKTAINVGIIITKAIKNVIVSPQSLTCILASDFLNCTAKRIAVKVTAITSATGSAR